MIGEKFANYTVVQETDNKNGKTNWLCRCKCGNTAIRTTGQLNHIAKHAPKQESCKKCEFLLKEQLLIKNLLGREVGDWVVEEFVGKNNYGTKMWLCRCKCGVEKKFTTSYLTGNGRRQATQCKQCELREMEESNRTTSELPNRIWNKIKHTADRRSISFDISQEEALLKFLEQGGKCALTGLSLHFTKLNGRYWRYTNASLDRIDSSKPYVADNVQWVDKRINMMKQQYSQNVFIELCKLVAENN